MIKQLKRVGNSNALTIDKTLMELIGLEKNGQVQITVHDRSLVITPVKPRIDKEIFEACLKQVMHKRRKLLQRLAQ